MLEMYMKIDEKKLVDFKHTPFKMSRLVVEAAERGAKLPERIAKSLTRVRTGRVKRSIKSATSHDRKSITITVSSDVFYSKFLEHGWHVKGKFQRPRPFLRPALVMAQPRIISLIERAIKDGWQR